MGGLGALFTKGIPPRQLAWFSLVALFVLAQRRSAAALFDGTTHSGGERHGGGNEMVLGGPRGGGVVIRAMSKLSCFVYLCGRAWHARLLAHALARLQNRISSFSLAGARGSPACPYARRHNLL